MSGPLPIGTDAPDFSAMTTDGPINFHDWLGTAGVCSSHIPRISPPSARPSWGTWRRSSPSSISAERQDHRPQRGSGESHSGWSKDIEETQGTAPNYPMIADSDLKVAKLYGMLPAEAGEYVRRPHRGRQPTVRNVFVIGPDKKIKLLISYPMSTGRNFDEVLRVHRLAAADGEAQGGDAGQLEKRRATSSSCPRSPRRKQGEVSAGAGRRPSRISASCRNRKAERLHGASGRPRALPLVR